MATAPDGKSESSRKMINTAGYKKRHVRGTRASARALEDVPTHPLPAPDDVPLPRLSLGKSIVDTVPAVHDGSEGAVQRLEEDWRESSSKAACDTWRGTWRGWERGGWSCVTSGDTPLETVGESGEATGSGGSTVGVSDEATVGGGSGCSCSCNRCLPSWAEAS